MKCEKREGPRYRGPSRLRPCCTFTPASRCRFTPALTVVIKSVNPEYQTYERDAEEVNIIGRVIWAAKRL